jgi:hypothetical protein
LRRFFGISQIALAKGFEPNISAKAFGFNSAHVPHVLCKDDVENQY